MSDINLCARMTIKLVNRFPNRVPTGTIEHTVISDRKFVLTQAWRTFQERLHRRQKNRMRYPIPEETFFFPGRSAASLLFFTGMLEPAARRGSNRGPLLLALLRFL
jgi:hypothetical protein